VARQWLEDREAELLPVPYYHVVFTLPAAISAIAFQNKAVVYDLLFRTAAETLITIAADPKHLGARIGLTAVLHTWGSALTHHPHVHLIVPGGGLSLDGGRWVACRRGFFLPVRVLSCLFRGLFLEGLDALHKASRQELCVSVRHGRTDRQPVVGIPYLPWDSIAAASDNPQHRERRRCAGRLSRAGRPMVARMDG
jgi:hypothetical protein